SLSHIRATAFAMREVRTIVPWPVGHRRLRIGATALAVPEARTTVARCVGLYIAQLRAALAAPGLARVTSRPGGLPAAARLPWSLPTAFHWSLRSFRSCTRPPISCA